MFVIKLQYLKTLIMLLIMPPNMLWQVILVILVLIT